KQVGPTDCRVDRQTVGDRIQEDKQSDWDKELPLSFVAPVVAIFQSLPAPVPPGVKPGSNEGHQPIYLPTIGDNSSRVVAERYARSVMRASLSALWAENSPAQSS